MSESAESMLNKKFYSWVEGKVDRPKLSICV